MRSAMLAFLAAALTVAQPLASPVPGRPLYLPGARAGGEDLVIERHGGRVVRLRQRANGIPVWRGSVALRLDVNGQVVRIADARRAVGPFDPRPAISASAALRAAAAASPVPLLPGASGRGSAALVVVPGAAPRLAWEVRLPPLRRTDNPHALVDATDGKLLAWWNRVFRQEHANHLAAVFADPEDASSALVAERILEHFPAEPDAGGHLVGERVVARNCCPREGCAESGQPLLVTGESGMGTYIEAVCDQRPRATNLRPEGNYIYSPAEEPGESTPIGAPADGDEFAEVNAYYHVNAAYDFVLALDPAFEFPSTARPLAVLVNYLETDYNSCIEGEDAVRCSKLVRFDNAMFSPAEGEGATDTLILGQGDLVDFAYDGDVITHEFGHLVVQAGGGLEGVALDEWGVWPIPGALNEAYADWLAAARSGDPVVGEYAGGAEGASGIRDLSSAARCPEDITGEVHDDSRPFSSALWDVRQALTGLMLPEDVDRAILDALMQLPTDASFDIAASQTLVEIESRAPAARPVAEEVFRRHGALGCERALDLEPGQTIDYLPLAGRWEDPRLADSFVPGPFQIRLHAPEGAERATLSFETWSRRTGLISGAIASGAPVRFRYDAGAVADGATVVNPTATAPNELAFALSGKCGGEVLYVALLNTGDRDRGAANLRVSYRVSAEKVEQCALPPEPEPTGPRVSVVSSGTVEEEAPPAAPPASKIEPEGCGCAEARGASAWPLVLAVALLLRRRPRRVNAESIAPGHRMARR